MPRKTWINPETGTPYVRLDREEPPVGLNGANGDQAPWGEIDGSLLEGARGPVPAFPLHVLSPLWAEWVESAAEASGASNDYLAQGLFACVAAICGAGVSVEITFDWREPLVLWQALVGSPSTGKSPAMTAAHFLLDPIEKDAGAGDPERKRALETKIEEAKISAEKWRTECATAIKAGTPSPLKPEAAMFNDRFVPTQIVVADTTIEALADVESGNSRGVALWRDELYAWLANFGRYANGGTDLAHFLEAWAAAKVTINRKSRDEPLIVPKFAVSILGGIPPDRLAEALAGADDGMAARFLYSWPDPVAHVPLLDRRRPSTDDAVARLRRIARIIGTGDRPRILPLEREAVLLFDRFIDRLSGEIREREGVEAGWLGKGKGTTARLAAVLALLAWSERDDAPSLLTLPCESVRHAAELWDQYFRPHAIATFNRAGRSAQDREARRATQWLLKEPVAPVSLLDVRRKALSERPDEDGTRRVIERLCRGNILRALPTEVGKQGGRPARRWEVNPALRERRV